MKIAVVAYIFYPDLLEEILDHINHLSPDDFDLFISTPLEHCDFVTQLTSEHYAPLHSTVTVRSFPNVGYDIAPFLAGFGEQLQEYDLVCKIHSKKSMHMPEDDGNAWRRYCLHELLGSGDIIRGNIARFRKNRKLGILAPQGLLINHRGQNTRNLSQFLETFAIARPIDDLFFAAGSMFWLRPEAIKPVFAFFDDFSVFEKGLSPSTKDGTIAHGIERLFCAVAESEHYQFEVTDAPTNPNSFNILKFLSNATLYGTTSEHGARTMYFRYRYLLDRPHNFAAKHPKNVCFYTYTTNLDDGRGDLYVALGLACRLEEIGYDVRILPSSCWHILPKNTSLVVGMLEHFDPTFSGTPRIREYRSVAWIRNKTEQWLSSVNLYGYDSIMCSSPASVERVQFVRRDKVHLLRLAAEEKIFRPMPGADDCKFDIVSSVNNWVAENPRALFSHIKEINSEYVTGLFGTILGDHSAMGIDRAVYNPLPYFSMPLLYNSTKIIIDDLNEHNQPYGNINSRFFEGLACGVAVIYNQALYEDKEITAISSIPHIYSDSLSLAKLTDTLLDDRKMLTRLAQEGREEIIAKHTWSIRARQFDKIYKTERRSRNVPGNIPTHTVSFYPAYLDNPYQTLFYKQLWPYGFDGKPIGDISQLPANTAIVHLHWTAPITQFSNDIDLVTHRIARFRENVETIQQRGGKLLWTVHNLLPHETLHYETEIEFRRWLCEKADAIIVHNPETRELATMVGYQIPDVKEMKLPHPRYNGFYPNSVTREEARIRLGITLEKRVFLFMGQLRKYKAIDKILDCAKFLEGDDSIEIVIAGKSLPSPYFDIDIFSHLPHNVRLFPRRVSDWELQFFYKAADYALFVNDQILNSGSLTLARDFGTPLVAVNCSGYRQGFDSRDGWLYNSHEDLAEVIREKSRHPFSEPERLAISQRAQETFDHGAYHRLAEFLQDSGHVRDH
jgi:glycosyltransferase involved in cell wall biosynthesis